MMGQVQRMPSQPDGSVRFAAGAWGIANALSKGLSVTFGAAVKSVKDTGGAVRVQYTGSDGESQVEGKVLVVAAPPRLVESKIKFDPELPKKLSDAMRSTPTWMEDTMKVIVTYKKPFWRENGLSGAGYPRGGGPLAQVWDNCVEDEGGKVTSAALGMFILGGACERASKMKPEEIQQEVLEQLSGMFGKEARDGAVAVTQQNWLNEEFTHAKSAVPGGQFGASILRKNHGNVVFAGTETEDAHGHMEGAIVSGERAAEQVSEMLKKLKKP